MNGLPYYKAYPRDFIEGTVGMPFEVKCAYRVVLDLVYMQGGNLPDDARYISGLLGCSIRKWNSIRDELVKGGKLVVSGEFLTNYRAVSELETLSKLQDKQRENASVPRKNKELGKPRLNHTEPEPDTKKEEPLRGPLAVSEKGLEAEVFALGKAVLGKSSGGVIVNLRKACEYDDAYALDLLRQAAEKQEPMAWVQAAIKSVKDRPYRGLINVQAGEGPVIESREDREWRKREVEIYRSIDCAPPTPEEAARWKAMGLS